MYGAVQCGRCRGPRGQCAIVCHRRVIESQHAAKRTIGTFFKFAGEAPGIARHVIERSRFTSACRDDKTIRTRSRHYKTFDAVQHHARTRRHGAHACSGNISARQTFLPCNTNDFFARDHVGQQLLRQRFVAAVHQHTRGQHRTRHVGFRYQRMRKAFDNNAHLGKTQRLPAVFFRREYAQPTLLAHTAP